MFILPFTKLQMQVIGTESYIVVYFIEKEEIFLFLCNICYICRAHFIDYVPKGSTDAICRDSGVGGHHQVLLP